MAREWLKRFARAVAKERLVGGIGLARQRHARRPDAHQRIRFEHRFFDDIGFRLVREIPSR